MAANQRKESPAICIGDEAGNHVSIHVMGWMHPKADDFWDGNWLISPIEVAVGGFRCEAPAGLRMDELLQFREALQRLHSSLQGEAVLDSIEGWIQLHVAANRRGGLQLTGKVCDRPGGANTLTFAIEGLDQTHLPGLISALVAAEGRFPIRGQRDQ